MKYDDVMGRARLSASTAQYVLKAGALPGTPPSGARGRHRVFSPEQAFRFALATRLVMGGVPLRKAAGVVEFCLRRLGGYEAVFDPPRRPNGRAGRWILETFDDERVRLWGDVTTAMPHPEEWYSIGTGETVAAQAFPTPLSRHEINLTRLARELTRP